MDISTDHVIIWQHSGIVLNATLIFTWLIMGLLVGISAWIGRHLSSSTQISPGQNVLEVIVEAIAHQIREISDQDPDPYLPFVGTLFIFIATSNLLSIIPGFLPPTGSLSTTAALAICVFIAIPLFGIRRRGWIDYFKDYIKPTPLLLPFNLIGEFARTLALSVRLFGNVMSGAMIMGILLSIAPLVFPVIMQVMGLLTGLIQAYIFAILTMVYIAAATRIQQDYRHGDNAHE